MDELTQTRSENKLSSAISRIAKLLEEIVTEMKVTNYRLNDLINEQKVTNKMLNNFDGIK